MLTVQAQCDNECRCRSLKWNIIVWKVNIFSQLKIQKQLSLTGFNKANRSAVNVFHGVTLNDAVNGSPLSEHPHPVVFEVAFVSEGSNSWSEWSQLQRGLRKWLKLR